MQIDKNLKRLLAFQRIFEGPTFVYMNILNMRIKNLCHRNENYINKKFVG